MERYQQDLAAMRANPLYGMSKEAIAKALLPTLEASIRATVVQPLVASSHESMSQMVSQHIHDVNRDVMPKVAVAMQVTDTLQAWLRGDISRVPP